MILNQNTSKKTRHVLDLSKVMPCCIKHNAGINNFLYRVPQYIFAF